MDIHWNDRDLDRLLFYNSLKSADIYIYIYIILILIIYIQNIQIHIKILLTKYIHYFKRVQALKNNIIILDERVDKNVEKLCETRQKWPVILMIDGKK